MSDAADRLAAALADRYRIERELGQGGMATVYLAADLKHDRKVALKVLRPELSAILGGERFLAEIKTTANLQHPHILSLFDSGEADGIVYYVMPFVEGESLRDRLTREKQLPVDEAVRIAREVADALEYAHGHGIVHRDIKPENILLHGGHALVADFGIALAASRSEGGTRMTETGMSLGTPQYMAPEQAMGQREITPKADIYALGCVLYESLAGEPPFSGPTPQAIVARVMTEQPRALTLQRRTIPQHVEAAVVIALEKLPADRFASAAEFARALVDPGVTAATGVHPRTAAPGGRARARLAQLVGMGLAGVVLGVTAARLGRSRAGVVPPAFSYYLGGDTAHTITGNFALSPDGTVLVYRAVTASGPLLFKRRLSELDPSPIPGTADAEEAPGTIFFAPDGITIGFSTGAVIKRVRLDGAELQTVAPLAGGFAGGTWGPDGSIVYADWPDSGLMRVAAQGGTPTRVRVSERSGFLPVSPRFLPGGKTLLCVNFAHGPRIGVLALASGVFTPVVTGVSPIYVAPGTLVYGRLDGSVMAQPFDPGRADTTGVATLVLQNVMAFYGAISAFDVSATGVVTYLPRSTSDAMLRLFQRDGTSVEIGSGSRFWGPRFSPDGRRIAYGAYQANGSQADLWSYDLAAGTDQRLTSGGQADRDYNDATWSPDGRWIVLSGLDSVGKPGKDLYLMPGDATAQPALLLDRPGHQWPTDWTRDGQAILFTDTPGDGPQAIWLMRRSGGSQPVPVVKTMYNSRGGRLSPDGRWLAYESEDTGRPEVYVQRFPGPGPRLRVSTAGGQMPVWSRSGRELYYWFRDQLMVARLTPGSEMAVATRASLFRAAFPAGSVLAQYDAHPDGRRFVLSVVPESANRLAVVAGLPGLVRR